MDNQDMKSVLRILPTLVSEPDNFQLLDEMIAFIREIPEEEIHDLDELNYTLSGVYRSIRNMVDTPDLRPGMGADLKADFDRVRENGVLYF